MSKVTSGGTYKLKTSTVKFASSSANILILPEYATESSVSKPLSEREALPGCGTSPQ